MVEYTLFMALVAVVTIGGVRRLGWVVTDKFNEVQYQISGASSLPCFPGFPGCP